VVEKDQGVFLFVSHVGDMDGIRDRLLAAIPDLEMIASKVLPDEDDDD
jgi:hypothetical protein